MEEEILEFFLFFIDHSRRHASFRWMVIKDCLSWWQAFSVSLVCVTDSPTDWCSLSLEDVLALLTLPVIQLSFDWQPEA